MKNKFLFCAIAILLAATSQAQRARIEGGINLANISVTNDGRVDNANMLTSFRVGIIGDIPLASIVYLQPGIVYTAKARRFRMEHKAPVVITNKPSIHFTLKFRSTLFLKHLP